MARAREEYDQGRFAEAAPLYQHLEDPGSTDPGLSSSLTDLAEIYRSQGKYDRASRILRNVLATPRRDSDVIRAMQELGGVYQGAGRFSEAAEIYREALARAGSASATPFFFASAGRNTECLGCSAAMKGLG